METEQYPNITVSEPPSGSLPRPPAAFLADVARLRSMPDDMVAVTTVPDDAPGDLRFTFRNGETVVTDYAAMIWHLKHNRNLPTHEVLPFLAFLLARKIFRVRGGKKALGVPFRDWLAAC